MIAKTFNPPMKKRPRTLTLKLNRLSVDNVVVVNVNAYGVPVSFVVVVNDEIEPVNDVAIFNELL